MLSKPDFKMKQTVFVFFNEGEKLAFHNDNMIVRDKTGKIKFQTTCYRLFLVYAVGNASITSALIQKANKFGFVIALLTPGFRLYSVIGSRSEGNTLLHKKQYSYNQTDLARLLVMNKISTQYRQLMKLRNKNTGVKEALDKIKNCYNRASESTDLRSLLAYEGISSKVYFNVLFQDMNWSGRQPRVKKDINNTVLDIGYTLLFSYVDSLLQAFGFDTYCGLLHTMFYMRKSLTCDIVEPFRFLIDKSVVKAYHLGMIHDEDFMCQNTQYKLKWEVNAKYVNFLMAPIIESSEEIYSYVYEFYKCFMKSMPIEKYPFFREGGTDFGSHKL